MRILLQFPEGLKRQALSYAQGLEKQGNEVFLSASPCYGACDLALEEAKAISADKIIHFGHARFINKKLPIEVEYVEYHIDVDLERFKDAASRINAKSVVLATTIQHIHQLEGMKKILEDSGKKVFIGKGALAEYPGQVLGCDGGAVSQFADKSDAIIFVGDGNFHALAIDTDKPIFVIHPKSGESRQINKEIEKQKKRRKGAILKAIDAKVFGIVVSTKPGQFNPGFADKAKKELEMLGKKAEILVCGEISALALNNFISFDCYIISACPRMADDSEMFGKPLLNIGMFVELIGILKELKK